MALRQAYSPGTPTPFHGMYRVEKVLGGVIPILATDLVAGGQVALFKAPAGFVLVSAAIDTSQLDSNGSPTLTASLGDALNNNRLLNASTAFRTATAGVQIGTGARGYQFPTDTDILLTFPAGAATAAAGNVIVYLVGYLNV